MASAPYAGMHSDSGDTTSLWMATAEVPSYPALTADASTEVCVVGAGIAGLSVAYHLARAGRRVMVIDDGPIGGGETARTTAHLTDALDDRYFRLERMHGEDGARLAAVSHRDAIDRIEAICGDERIDCGFERLDGYLFLGGGDSEDDLARELDAAHRAGLESVEPLDRIPGVPFDSGACLRFPGQAQFHPLRYLSGLARAITRDGGAIHTGTHVEGFESRPRRPQVKTSAGHTVTANAVVFATNSPINDWVKIHTKQAPYRTFVIGCRVPRGSVPRALYWDTPHPYHYIRVHPDDASNGAHDILLVGGEDHKTGQRDDAEQRFRCLEEWTVARFPMVESVAYRWSGQVMEPVDYLGFIGRNPGDEGDVFIATGDSGQGMTHGTIAGMLIADLVAGREHPWARLYDPSRRSLRAAREFARENLNVAAQYRDYITPGDVTSVDEIPRGSGAIVRRGRHKLAVYRDDHGVLHERSAVCPHLYCIVDWNSAEKTWDCPCHGSRFDAMGNVVNGPAAAPLGEAPEGVTEAAGREH